MFKTLLFILLVYFAVRAISRLFLPSKNKKKAGPRFFYQVFQNIQQQQKQNRKNSGDHGQGNLEEIEEAEYEEITEDETDTSS